MKKSTIYITFTTNDAHGGALHEDRLRHYVNVARDAYFAVRDGNDTRAASIAREAFAAARHTLWLF